MTPEAEPPMATLRAGRLRIMLAQYPVTMVRRGRGVHFFFGVTDVDVYYSQLKGRGIEVQPPADEGWGGRFITLTDPDAAGGCGPARAPASRRSEANTSSAGGAVESSTVSEFPRHITKTFRIYRVSVAACARPAPLAGARSLFETRAPVAAFARRSLATG